MMSCFLLVLCCFIGVLIVFGSQVFVLLRFYLAVAGTGSSLKSDILGEGIFDKCVLGGLKFWKSGSHFFKEF